MSDDDRESKPLSYPHNVTNRIIRSHTYYTSALNASGHDASITAPQMAKWNYFDFICIPWKSAPISQKVFRRHFANDLLDFYFCNDEEYEDVYDERLIYDLIEEDEEKEKENSIELVIKQSDDANTDDAGTDDANTDNVSHVHSKYLSRYSQHFDLHFKKPSKPPNMIKCKTNSSESSSDELPPRFKPSMIRNQSTESSISNASVQSTPMTPCNIGTSPFTPNLYITPTLEPIDSNNASTPPPSILLTQNDNINENNNVSHSRSSTMVVNPVHFIDPT
eukprot:412921_1